MRIAVFLVSATIREYSFSEENLAELRAALPAAECALCRDEAEFLAALPEAEIAVVWEFEQAWFALAPKLKLLSTPAAGRDYFQVSPPPGVRVWYGSFHGAIMAETVAGMILAASRGLMMDAGQTRGASSPRPQEKAATAAWPRQRFTGRVRTLRSSTVVILGFGNIGRQTGKLLEAFGARVIGVTRGNVSDLDTLLPLADHLVCALPSGAGTDGLLGARRLALLKPSAFLHNVGRGNCVDEAALADALGRGALAGAFLDVFQTEPLPADSPLRRAPNAFLYPHVSAVAPEYMSLYVAELAEKLAQEPL